MPKLRFTDQLWVQTSLLMLAIIPVSILAAYLDQRQFNGINIWIKPLKFQLSAVVHLMTLYLVASLMTAKARRFWLLRILVWASCIATVFEIFIISLRASQGTASHFNFQTETDAIIYGLMGIGAITMLLPALYLGIRFVFKQQDFRVGPGLHLGVILGFVAGSVLTLLYAGYMSANGSHWTSGQDSDVGGLWLFGWSQTGGDLRPAHFFALHLLQALPLIGWLADRFVTPLLARSAVIGGLLVLGGLSTFAFVQARAGEAFLRINPPTGLENQAPITAQETAFWNELSSLCGATFTGEMTYPKDGQDSFRGKLLTAEFARCQDNTIEVPFTVGDDHSRTWNFTKTPAGIRFKHDHRHNGKADPISNYGGMSDDGGTKLRHSFPADAYTKQLIPEASTNVWTLSLEQNGDLLRYHLERHNKPRFTAELKRSK